jgi:fatty acid desaturase
MTLTDPIFVPEAHLSAWEGRLLPYLNDARDLPFIRLSLTLLVVNLPLAVLLYVPGMYRWWLAVPYFVLNSLVFLAPFTLMLHNTSHRPLFKRRYQALNLLIPWALGPFFGETPDTYFAHHVGMHHAENNLRADLSSTLRFRRDSLPHFLGYFLRFFFVGWAELTRYHWNKKRYKLLRRLWVGELTFYATVALLASWNFYATLSVFIIPYCFARLALMAGNWAQHAFVDLATPESPYRNSITCVNTSYNRRCFNDGYHIGHHVKPTLHWTQMPADFRDNAQRYCDERAIVFRSLDYFSIWALLMTHQYRLLSRYYVELDTARPKSEPEVIALLRSRTLASDVRRERR